MQKVSDESYVKDLKKAVSNLGLKLDENVLIRGKSGVNHFFRLAIRERKVIAIIHVLKHLTITDVCKVYAYKVDTEVPQLILCSNLSDEALKVASQLDIEVINEFSLEKLKEFILKRKGKT